MVCIPDITVRGSGLSSAIGGAIWLTRTRFKHSSSQLSFEVLGSSIALFGDEYLACLYTLPLMLSFNHPPSGPWRRNRHSGDNTALLLVIESVSERPRSPESNFQSSARPSGRLGCLFVHFLSSIS